MLAPDRPLVQYAKSFAVSPLHIFLRSRKKCGNSRLTNADRSSDLLLSEAGGLQFCDSVFPVHASLYRYTDINTIGIPMYFCIRMPI